MALPHGRPLGVAEPYTRPAPVGCGPSGDWTVVQQPTAERSPRCAVIPSRSRCRRGVAALVVAVLAAGCSSAPPPSATAGSTPGGAATAGPPGTPSTPGPVAGQLPDLGLANVTTEAANARGATIGPDGGTISATGANGAVYTLSIPAGALDDDTEIGLYPVSSLATIPGPTGIAAGAQFSPDGLHLIVPATLTIELPAGVDATGASGVSWTGDGAGVHAYPVLVTDRTLTLNVLHFSGDGVVEPPLEPLSVLGECLGPDFMDEELEGLRATGVTEPAEYRSVLTTCYKEFVEPAMLDAEQYAEDHDRVFDPTVTGPTAAFEDRGVDGYDAWLLDIQLVGSWLGDPGFDVKPLSADSRVPASHLLRAWYDAINDECVAAGDPAADEVLTLAALLLARGALDHERLAQRWGVATVANRLDLQALLDDLCVQVVIDPSRAYAGLLPGDSANVTVPVGYTIAGGPVRHDRELQVDVNLTGSTDIQTVFSAPTGLATATVDWPKGTDPIKIDVSARLHSPFDDIARFDRITKHAERLSFTFDTGFDGWSHGTVGPSSAGTPWGLVNHLSIGGGVIHMDGRGSGSGGKAWIFRSFTLPASTTSLSFDVSAEIIAGSSSSVRVRIEADGKSTTLLSQSIGNGTNRLAFGREKVDISSWAGHHVTIYIEQNYNGLDGFDKEIYVDNVRISTS
jgi:hypothetical protein